MTKLPENACFPFLVAHRGAMTEAPENTTVAFDRALSCNVDGIEFDVQLTSDGIPVVFHDDTLHRVTGRRASVSDYPFEILDTFDYGEWFSKKFKGISLLRLDEALDAYASRTILMIELKTRHGGRDLTWNTIDLIMERVARERLDSIYLLSFDREALLFANSINPDLKTVLNMAPRDCPHIPMQARQNPLLHGFGVPFKALNASLVRQAHDAGKKVMIYTCNTRVKVAAALDAGADFVLTDNPAAVADYFFLSRKQGYTKMIHEIKDQTDV